MKIEKVETSLSEIFVINQLPWLLLGVLVGLSAAVVLVWQPEAIATALRLLLKALP